MSCKQIYMNITRASRSWYILLYNWPPNRDLLLKHSPLELIYFLILQRVAVIDMQYNIYMSKRVRQEH